MALGIKWQMEWMSLGDVKYTLSIYEEGYEGDAITLTGGSNPFSTDDDDDDDLLIAGRISTGTFNAIDEEQDDGTHTIDGLMPDNDTEHLVVLTDVDNNILWQGFMQSEQFGRDMYIPLSEVSFSVSDVLESLDSVMMDDSETFRMQTFAEYIAEAIGKAQEYGVTINNVVYPKEWKDDEYQDWLQISVARENFFEENDDDNEDDPDYAKYDRKSYKELLEAIAGILGWTVTFNGTDLRFVSMKSDVEYEMLTVTQLENIASGTAETATDTTIQSEVWTLEAQPGREAANEMVTLQGYKTVKVTGDVNPIDDTDIEVSVEGLDEADAVNLRVVDTTYARMLIYKSGQSDFKLHDWALDQATTSSETATATEVAYKPNTPIYTHSGYIRMDIAKVDIYDSSDSSKISYSYFEGLVVRKSLPTYTPSASPIVCDFGTVKLAEWKGKHMPPQCNGCLDFYFKIQGPYDGAYYTGNVPFKLQIGDKYLKNVTATTYEWTTEENTCTVMMEDGEVKTTKTLNDGYEGASHLVIPINEMVGGEIKLTMYGNADYLKNWSDFYVISDLELTYCNDEASAFDETKDTNTYNAHQDSTWDETKEVELIMTTKTKKCKSGFGCLYYDGGFFEAGDVTWLDESIIPEKALLSRMKTAYFAATDKGQPAIMVEGNVRPSIGEHLTYKDEDYMVVARSTEWADTKTVITIEKINE